MLDNRFENMKLANYDSVADEKTGCFSIVFRADDRLSGKPVALKFYDLDPQRTNDIYRRNSFQREQTILGTLVTAERCLQLASAMMPYILVVPLGGDEPVTIGCQYFAVEWLDGEIDDYFLSDKCDTLDKLRLFNEIVLAVEALHAHEVFHRDLKADNLRSYQESLKRIVVAIDLGTAARYDSQPIQPSYHRQAGAPAYASPEAIHGLAGDRVLAPYTDIYALGCLLYELFNQDYFYIAVRNKNNFYDNVLLAAASAIDGKGKEEKAAAWTSAISKLGRGISAIDICESESSVPLGVAGILNEILSSLTHINWVKRPKALADVRRKIWTAIRIISNEREYQRKLQQAKVMKLRRQDKAREKDAKRAALPALKD